MTARPAMFYVMFGSMFYAALAGTLLAHFCSDANTVRASRRFQTRL